MPRFIPHSPEPTPRQMLALASGLNAALRCYEARGKHESQ